MIEATVLMSNNIHSTVYIKTAISDLRDMILIIFFSRHFRMVTVPACNRGSGYDNHFIVLSL